MHLQDDFHNFFLFCPKLRSLFGSGYILIFPLKIFFTALHCEKSVRLLYVPSRNSFMMSNIVYPCVFFILLLNENVRHQNSLKNRCVHRNKKCSLSVEHSTLGKGQHPPSPFILNSYNIFIVLAYIAILFVVHTLYLSIYKS